jgi:hypothetical protein
VNTVMNLRVTQNIGKFLSGCAAGSFPRRVQLRGISYLQSCNYLQPKNEYSGPYNHFIDTASAVLNRIKR